MGLAKGRSTIESPQSAKVAPFRVSIPPAAIDDLKERLARTRWTDRQTVDDWSQGVPLAYLHDVCQYWAKDYSWTRLEDRLNGIRRRILENRRAS